jgi:hypothetical protein
MTFFRFTPRAVEVLEKEDGEIVHLVSGGLQLESNLEEADKEGLLGSPREVNFGLEALGESAARHSRLWCIRSQYPDPCVASMCHTPAGLLAGAETRPLSKHTQGPVGSYGHSKKWDDRLWCIRSQYPDPCVASMCRTPAGLLAGAQTRLLGKRTQGPVGRYRRSKKWDDIGNNYRRMLVHARLIHGKYGLDAEVPCDACKKAGKSCRLYWMRAYGWLNRSPAPGCGECKKVNTACRARPCAAYTWQMRPGCGGGSSMRGSYMANMAWMRRHHAMRARKLGGVAASIG